MAEREVSSWPSGDDGRPMQFSLPGEIVETILLGPADDRRVLQDSPLLGDVWAAYALDPGARQDVLITPHFKATAADVAGMIRLGRPIWNKSRNQMIDEHLSRPLASAKIAYLQGLVAAELYFDEVLCILVPLTLWWQQQGGDRIEGVAHRQAALVKLLQTPPGATRKAGVSVDRENYSSLERYIALAGLIFWISKRTRRVEDHLPAQAASSTATLLALPELDEDLAFALYAPYAAEIIKEMFDIYPMVEENRAELVRKSAEMGELDDEALASGFIFQVSLNRRADTALDRSVPAVKADAAQSLFRVACDRIVWGVIDSGIDGSHPALQMVDKQATTDPNNPVLTSRVRKTFDFTRIREIVTSEVDDVGPTEVDRIARTTGLSFEATQKYLKQVASDAENRRPINWADVEKLITLKDPPPPTNPHGTHVAGIIGADGKRDGESYSGMCPDIRLYDFRVLGKTAADTEFAVIAALQYIRYINDRHNYITVHGVNLSLSIPHNVRNYACGRTPVCNECERLVEGGVVVVAAAGNRGFQKFQTADGPFENYAAFSITDPGNGEGVITVGSTHGNWPQTYGISFFSSRGPTGDGRLKPDLVAPGERVYSTVLNHGWAPESGTSMAAPHVSGAAAMLLARYEELVGQPRRVKQILCASATDLGRERSFQGHGMLDVLRAFQSI
ncbi:S8 family peptidase [Rhodopseudomonas sp. BR0M22]|uniref:S8 family peptidase n=1 Tax=Rhodopseudomonas sp. BR0M22 TaxID=2269369 RepID=UPI0013DEB47B|nr:S8 family peptidase [Rhodopseudomonas sp. BR0M22]NEW91320.1 peptidase S8 [Rhodopseudomonas sp. BR0M22]